MSRRVSTFWPLSYPGTKDSEEDPDYNWEVEMSQALCDLTAVADSESANSATWALPVDTSGVTQWRRDCSAEPSRESLQCLFTVEDGSEWSFENKRSGAIGVGGFARENSMRRISKTIK